MAGRDEAGAEGGAHRGFRGGFGRHRGGPFGRRGPRMFDSGALRLVVLGLIGDEPRHGYDIIKALETRFHGSYSPSPGAIYPMLQMLEEADLVASETTGNKRLYTITANGRSYLDENKPELDKINRQLDEMSGEASHIALMQEIHALRAALHDKLRGGALNPDQLGRLRDILTKARGDLEGL